MRELLAQNVNGCKYFKWREVLDLNSWGVTVFPKDIDVYNNIIMTCKVLDNIREFIEKPMIITSMYRPEKYNQYIGGSKKSAHIDGLACDFIVSGVKSSEIRMLLYPHLKEFNIRIEALDTPHVHIDLKCEKDLDNKRRYFKP